MRYEILVDHGETANKCTIVPLSYRTDFAIRRFPRGELIKGFTADILLHPDGIPLDQLRTTNAASLAAIDCIWKRLSPIIHWLEKPLPTLARIPDGFVTAYPRLSKHGNDPDGGLATIEALFIGAAFLGHWDTTLLSEYFFGERFLELNDQRFRDLGVTPGPASNQPIFQPRYPRSAWKRRVSRGRAGEREGLAALDLLTD